MLRIDPLHGIYTAPEPFLSAEKSRDAERPGGNQFRTVHGGKGGFMRRSSIVMGFTNGVGQFCSDIIFLYGEVCQVRAHQLSKIPDQSMALVNIENADQVQSPIVKSAASSSTYKGHCCDSLTP